MSDDELTGLSASAHNTNGQAPSHAQEEPAPAQRTPSPGTITYKTKRQKTYLVKETLDGNVDILLANFTAKITADLIMDDDVAEPRRFYEITARIKGRPELAPRIVVPATDFASMRWVVQLGSDATITAGPYMRDHLRAAIQSLSTQKTIRQIFTHTGWRKIHTRWVYLHAGGAIGAEGLVSTIETRLDQLADYELPAPPQSEGLRQAIRTTLEFLAVAPDHHTVPLLGAAFRAVLDPADFSLYLAGRTGIFKTELAARVQQFFGARMDAHHLPANWSSSGNALERIASAAKDAVLVIDDFVPQGRAERVAGEHGKADRVLRAQGNKSGRQRLTTDGHLQPTYEPRGIIISTGEDIPLGQSLQARILVLNVSPGDVNPVALTACQHAGAQGVYAQAMAAFIQWLAQDYDTVPGFITTKAATRRGDFQAGHRRNTDIAAHLLTGFETFLLFAKIEGVISSDEEKALQERGLQALQAAVGEQQQLQKTSDPVELYLRYLDAALTGGHAHVASMAGLVPEHPHNWGWRPKDELGGYHQGGEWQATSSGEWRSQGRRIGWIEGDNLYLDPIGAFAVVQEMGRRTNHQITLTDHTLRKRLYEAGKLASIDTTRKTLTIRRVVEGKRTEVLHLKVTLHEGHLQQLAS
jgi:hypothetical protein